MVPETHALFIVQKLHQNCCYSWGALRQPLFCMLFT